MLDGFFHHGNDVIFLKEHGEMTSEEVKKGYRKLGLPIDEGVGYAILEKHNENLQRIKDQELNYSDIARQLLPEISENIDWSENEEENGPKARFRRAIRRLELRHIMFAIKPENNEAHYKGEPKVKIPLYIGLCTNKMARSGKGKKSGRADRAMNMVRSDIDQEMYKVLKSEYEYGGMERLISALRTLKMSNRAELKELEEMKETRGGVVWNVRTMTRDKAQI